MLLPMFALLPMPKLMLMLMSMPKLMLMLMFVALLLPVPMLMMPSARARYSILRVQPRVSGNRGQPNFLYQREQRRVIRQQELVRAFAEKKRGMMVAGFVAKPDKLRAFRSRN
jgi:hypothetical protein